MMICTRCFALAGRVQSASKATRTDTLNWAGGVKADGQQILLCHECARLQSIFLGTHDDPRDR